MTVEYGHYSARAAEVQTTADLHLSWDVPFTPGTLTAKGMKEGKVIREAEIHTTGASAKLILTADRPRISRLASDVVHVTVQVLDAEGCVVPTAADEITFAVRGPGQILGVDNGQPDSHESYQGPTRRAFHGLALVVMQSTGRPGVMNLTASSPPLASAEIAVEVS